MYQSTPYLEDDPHSRNTWWEPGNEALYGCTQAMWEEEKGIFLYVAWVQASYLSKQAYISC